LPMASCTKVMTALLVLEKVPDLGRYARVPAIATTQRGTKLGLRPGDRITIRNLLLGLMVRSATDCAVTLAHYVSGSEPAFAQLMNRRAAQLGLADTHYANSSGIRIADHYTSARDLAELGRVAMRNARFRDLAWRVWATVSWPPDHRVRIHSRNRFNELYDWVDGIKTGATSEAGCCLVASGKYGLRRFIVTTLHEPGRDQEVVDALRLFRYGASFYALRTVVGRGDAVAPVAVEGGGQVDAVAAATLRAVYRRGAEIVPRLALPATLATAPAPGSVLGAVTYYADGRKLGRVELLAANASSPSQSPSQSPASSP
ncbi:MAG: hypothetical protein WC709_12275, partial [Thermoleophilia bacterium]